MALITSGCDTMLSPEHQMALITSGCVIVVFQAGNVNEVTAALPLPLLPLIQLQFQRGRERLPPPPPPPPPSSSRGGAPRRAPHHPAPFLNSSQSATHSRVCFRVPSLWQRDFGSSFDSTTGEVPPRSGPPHGAGATSEVVHQHFQMASPARARQAA